MATAPQTETASAVGTISQILADFAAGLTYDDIPLDVRERAKYLILDAVGIAMASTRYPFADAILAGIYDGGSRARCLNLPNMTRFDGIAENDARAGHRILAESKRYVQEFSRGMEAAETGCSRRWSGSADYADCAQTETVVGRPTLEFRRFFWQKRVLVPTKNARVGSFLSDPMVRVGGNATSSMHSTGIRSTRFWCEEAELI